MTRYNTKGCNEKAMNAISSFQDDVVNLYCKPLLISEITIKKL